MTGSDLLFAVAMVLRVQGMGGLGAAGSPRLRGPGGPGDASRGSPPRFPRAACRPRVREVQPASTTAPRDRGSRAVPWDGKRMTNRSITPYGVRHGVSRYRRGPWRSGAADGRGVARPSRAADLVVRRHTASPVTMGENGGDKAWTSATARPSSCPPTRPASSSSRPSQSMKWPSSESRRDSRSS